ncbi:MAG: CDP-glycerol glycerophosphotransferase family protein [Proteobacteria bacterium]|nr:CDP-glycerol glycerophosphotransferase family protein [Pseudomonadota bacterium]
MRIVLFCQQKYSITILYPIYKEAIKQGHHQVLWYLGQKSVPDFEYKGEVEWTESIQAVYDFNPEAIYVPGNIVPYYLPGVKIQVFHGYAPEKPDHWEIRNYFDLYLTQGPYFTRGFQKLAEKHGTFEVMETGWPRQDWIFENLHTYDRYREYLLSTYKKKKIVLYAPTFSRRLTSLPYLHDAIKDLALTRDILLIMKFHPLEKKQWVDLYKNLADEVENILFMDDHNISKYILVADVMISDTSSVVHEFLLLNKPVITFRNISKEKFCQDVSLTEDLKPAFDDVFEKDPFREKRRWLVDNYDPYLDGKVGMRMIAAADDYIKRNGVPEKKRTNPFRMYKSIKTFGKIRR